MRTVLFLIRKEFLQILRNKGILPVILVMPVVQLLVLSYAADFEIKNLRLLWLDEDRSQTSMLLRNKLQGSAYFEMVGEVTNAAEAGTSLAKGVADLVVHVERDFEKHKIIGEDANIQVIIDAIDGTKAGLAANYISRLIGQFDQQIAEDIAVRTSLHGGPLMRIESTYSFWFNPHLNYKTFMVPGILVLLVTMIGAFIASMNIVREKELGTIEQLNVTPIRKHHFILGKLIPLWLIGLFEFSVGLLVARLVFEVPFVGSLGVIYVFAAMYMVMVLGMGMFISTVTDTQQQAMFISWFFLVIFILMGGIFTPIENMPDWAQRITLINPVRYFIEVIRLVMLKGAGLKDIAWQLGVVTVYALAINGLAVWRYRKVA